MASLEKTPLSPMTHSYSFYDADNEITGFPHSFDRSTGSNGPCILCKEPVSFFNAYYCNVCNNVAHAKCLPRVPNSCRFATDIYFLAKNSQHFALLNVPGQKYIQKIAFTHVPNTAFAINDRGEAFQFTIHEYNDPIKFTRPLEPLDKKRIKQISSGANFTMFLTESGHVYSFGVNTEGQLGLGSSDKNEVSSPTLIVEFLGKKITKIACGGSHTLALSSKNDVYSWGAGRYGRLGHGSQDIQWSPRIIELENPPQLAPEEKIETTLISCGWSHSIIIRQDTNKHTFLYTFGKGDNGQLGHGTAEHELRPKLVEEFAQCIVDGDGGYYHSIYLSSEGQVWVTGFGGEGQLGQGDTETLLRPKVISKLLNKTVSSIYCGSFGNVAVTGTGEPYIWGRVGSATYLLPEILVELNANLIQSISRGMFQSLAIVRATMSQKPKTAMTRQASNINLARSTTVKRELYESLTGEQFRRIVYNRFIIKRISAQNGEVYKRLSEHLQSREAKLQKEKQVNLLKARILKYKEAIKLQHTANEQGTVALEKMRSQQAAKHTAISDLMGDLAAKRLSLVNQKRTLEEQKNLLHQLNRFRDLLQLKLIRELKTIFPIKQSPTTGESSICGLVIPNLPLGEDMSYMKDPYPKHDKEMVAAAFGCVCQLLNMVSLYAKVPFKYEMVAVGSRSFIVDCVSNKSDQVYRCPLFATQKMEYFHYATVLLNTNIEQLLDYYNVELVGLGHTLPNLQKLMDHFEHDTISASFYDKIRLIRSNSNNNNSSTSIN